MGWILIHQKENVGMIKGAFEVESSNFKIFDSEMSELVARTGRHQQRYENGYRLIAGCIPFKYRYPEEDSDETSEKIVEVLMINSTSGPGLLFPKGGWENDETVEEAAARSFGRGWSSRRFSAFPGDYYFKSKTLQDEFSPEGLCKAAMYALSVKEELDSWPEQSRRQRSWLTVSEAGKCCRHSWMKKALEEGFSEWLKDGMTYTMKEGDHLLSSPNKDLIP